MRSTVLFLITLAVLFLSACSQSFKLKQEAHIDAIALCPQYQDYLDEDVHLALQELIQEIIRDYPGQIQLTECQPDASHKLNIYFEVTDLSGKKERVKSIIISTLGTALPIYLILINSPIWFPIWVFPWNTTVYKMDLDSDAEAEQRLIRNQARTLNLSGNRLRQIERQKKKIKKQVYKILRNLEEQQVKGNIPVLSPTG